MRKIFFKTACLSGAILLGFTTFSHATESKKLATTYKTSKATKSKKDKQIDAAPVVDRAKNTPTVTAAEEAKKADPVVAEAAPLAQPAIEKTTQASEKASIEFSNGEQYAGEIVAGEMQGFGRYVWTDGKRYEGNWVKGLIQGHGILIYPNGDRYEGEFTDGEPDGEGIYLLSNGDSYVGAWRNGMKHGKGRLIWSDGDYWEGVFENDKQTTNGTLVLGEGVSPQLIKSIEKLASAVLTPPETSKKSK